MAEIKSGYEIALKRIAAVRESMGTDQEILELNLSSLGMNKIPIELNDLSNLNKLNLSSNLIRKIENLNKLSNLKILNLETNQINKIENLDSLTNLEELFLNDNEISKIENLEQLTNLSVLNLYNNLISKIENLDKLIKLIWLSLEYNQISKIENLEQLTNLSVLNLNNNSISKLENLEQLTNLSELSLYNNSISKIENLDKLTSLSDLYLGRNQISKIENLDKLTKLSDLVLKSNQISKIENLDQLANLNSLYLSNNSISKLENLEQLTNLSELSLYNNSISKIENLERLTNLFALNLSSNQISNIFEIPNSFIDIIKKNSFNLKINNNPFIGKNGISTEDYPEGYDGNHTEQFIHDYYKFKDAEKGSFQKYELPVKIMLFGNSNAGKSDFSKFLREGTLVDPTKAGPSTDILEIRTWNKKVEDKDDWIATIFDFGGQDFYHATYQMFYTLDCIYCVLFEDASNVNEDAPNSESRLEHYQNYNVAYWLANVKYHLEKERQNEIKRNKNEDKEAATNNPVHDAIYLIRNKMDLAPDNSSLSQVLATMQQYQIFHRFDISLNIHDQQKYQSYRNILIENIQMDIHKGRSIEMLESDIMLLDYLYNYRERNEKTNKIALSELLSIAKEELNYEINPRNFITAVRRLRKSGIILLYEQKELQDWIWLRPDQVVLDFHNLLSKEKISQFNGRIPQPDYEDNFKDLADLLKLYNISFLDKNFPGGPHYIIPQYLQKENQDDALFAIAQDGLEILFAVQFKDFMPHGLFNRLACFFGGLPDQKYYVKNKVIFTINDVKVWLEIDPIQMSVIVKSANYKNSITAQLKAYLFRIIIAAYWNEPLISYKLYQHILHLFKNISVHQRDTVKEVLLNNNNDAYQELRDSVIKGINDDYLNEFQELQKKYPVMKDIWQFYSNLAKTVPNGMKVSLDNNYFVEYSNVVENSINTESEFIIEAKNSESKIKSIKTYLFNSFLDRTMKSPLKIFLSYAHEDFKIKERVLTYLKPLIRENKVEIWHDSMIRPGDSWDDEIQNSLEQCDIYLLLISPDSIASDYIIFKELQLAYQKNKKILGFLLSDCDWFSIVLRVETDQKVKLSNIQIFPRKTPSAQTEKTEDVPVPELLSLELFPHQSAAFMQIVNELKIIYDK